MLQGLKKTSLSLVVLVVIFLGLSFLKPQWQVWLPIIEQLPYWLFAACAILAAQFNRSRLTLAALLLLAYFYGVESGQLSDDVARHPIVIISISLFLSVLTFVKDRGLASVHSATRALSFIACLVFAFFWHAITAKWLLIDYADSIPLWLAPYLVVDMIIVLATLVMLARASYSFSLLNTALLVSSGFWLINYFQPELLPLAVMMTLLSAFYLFAIFADSYFLAYRDELTGLASRRALNQLALSLGRKYCVAMLDIDHFKKFNDTYGHDIGDQVLKLVASKLSDIEGGGRVFRYGGEEFTVVFPRRDIVQAAPHLEAVRQVIADYDIVLREENRQGKKQRDQVNSPQQTVSVTISIGVVSRHSGQTFEEAIKAADKALYEAKNRGRNRVVAIKPKSS